jgi:UDP-2,3-diacylglucosamine hydrolase
MKPWLFISDLHLSPERPAIIDLFIRFCNEVAPQAERLYILGDLVEYWIGDDDNAEGLQPAFAALAALAGRGVEIYFMAGNRDFLIGEELATRCNFSIIPDPHLVMLSDQPVLLSHGDSLCVDDVEYQQFRNMVRKPEWQQDFLARPLAEREAIALSMREKSRQATSLKDEIIMDVNQQAVEKMMLEHDTRLLIHGHTHRPAIHRFELAAVEVQRIVLADWYETAGYLCLEDTQAIQLSSFS